MLAALLVAGAGLDRDLVGLGSYIVNAQGGCNDCHSCPPFAPGGDPYLGEPIKINDTNYLAGGVAFGPFVSRNLTPVNGLPANKTLDEFIQLMRTGEDAGNGGQLLQVMPWPVYGRMTELDLTAVYTYLQAIPPASPGTVCGAPPPVAAAAAAAPRH